MSDALPWGWLNSTAPVMPGTEHQHDDVTLRPDERLRLGSIVAGWDEEVMCNVAAEPCGLAADWIYRCGCGRAFMQCTPHRHSSDHWAAIGRAICDQCEQSLPLTIPWLPL